MIEYFEYQNTQSKSILTQVIYIYLRLTTEVEFPLLQKSDEISFLVRDKCDRSFWCLFLCHAF